MCIRPSSLRTASPCPPRSPHLPRSSAPAPPAIRRRRNEDRARLPRDVTFFVAAAIAGNKHAAHGEGTGAAASCSAPGEDCAAADAQPDRLRPVQRPQGDLDDALTQAKPHGLDGPLNGAWPRARALGRRRRRGLRPLRSLRTHGRGRLRAVRSVRSDGGSGLRPLRSLCASRGGGNGMLRATAAGSRRRSLRSPRPLRRNGGRLWPVRPMRSDGGRGRPVRRLRPLRTHGRCLRPMYANGRRL
jgi:hypothetical protein